MEQKKFKDYLKTILFYFVVVSGGLFSLWWVLGPFLYYSDSPLIAELLFLAHLFLFLTFISTFAILRLYNSIVGNTRFTIKLREAMLKLIKEIPALERYLHSLGAVVKDNTHSVKKSTDSLDELKRSVDLNTSTDTTHTDASKKEH